MDSQQDRLAFKIERARHRALLDRSTGPRPLTQAQIEAEQAEPVRAVDRLDDIDLAWWLKLRSSEPIPCARPSPPLCSGETTRQWEQRLRELLQAEQDIRIALWQHTHPAHARPVLLGTDLCRALADALSPPPSAVSERVVAAIRRVRGAEPFTPAELVRPSAAKP